MKKFVSEPKAMLTKKTGFKPNAPSAKGTSKKPAKAKK